MTMENNKRKLKVYEKAISYHMGCAYSTTAYFPEIRLMGKWLTDYGFKPGDYVEVTARPNGLIITLCKPHCKEPDLTLTRYEKQKAAKIKAMVESARGQAGG
ncbi:MAG: SymE family type I addiction module toxin [Niabella sp.]|nr:SymE family type I addiction module toxin [Niabella sp.]